MLNVKLKDMFIKFTRSIWLFPALSTLVLIALTCLNINGSSIGIYHSFLYNTEDNNLLLNKPKLIRSDEWVVATPMTLAQYNSNFPTVNQNIGVGQNMEVILDVPSLNIWQLFKPHNLSFYVIPFDYAFAFKWWFMGYLLLLSVYFFVLHFLPKKRLLASLLALAILFSPFIQWWYQYITLAPIYYALFIYLVATKIYSTKSKKSVLLHLLLLIYLLVCFALVQYPAFQIAVALAIFPIFIADIGRQILTKKTLVLITGAIAACLVVVGFLLSIKPELQAISNSSYPGQRSVTSGGYNPVHLLASGFSPLFQSDSRSQHYVIPQSGAFNQSESSNFILLLPYLLPIILMLSLRRNNINKRFHIPASTRRISIAIFYTSTAILAWLLIPHLDILGKFLLLDKVPHARLIIAFGILNLMSIILIIKSWSRVLIKTSYKILCVLIITFVSLVTGYYVHSRFPEFSGPIITLLASLVIPLLSGLYIFNKHLTATILLCLFSISSTIYIHPLYHGTEALSNNSLVRTIKNIDRKDPGIWALEDTTLENIAVSSGVKSISGVFSYPQVDYWSKLAPKGTDENVYNRYAHITYNFDRDDRTIETVVKLESSDHIVIKTEACSDFTSKAKLSYIVTSTPIKGQSGHCLQKIDELKLTSGSLNIYKLIH